MRRFGSCRGEARGTTYRMASVAVILEGFPSSVGAELQDLELQTPLALQPSLLSIDILSLVADSVICTDRDGRIVLFNRAAEQCFGFRASEVVGRQVELLLPHAHRADHERQLRNFGSEQGTANRLMGHRREVAGRRKNGDEFPAEAMVSRQTIDGRTILTAVIRDITERKALEEEREVIARELDHRIRNVLSVVNSLVRLSARDAVGIEEFEESLLERLNALARTQSALKFGAQQSTNLHELLLSELDQYRTSDELNVSVEGPPVELRSRAAQALSLTFHELATNSAKYGSLSVAGGRVAVTVAFTEDGEKSFVDIEWRETGGPPPKPPERKGSGTSLIKQVIAATFRAEAVIAYPPEGLICRMSLPRARVGGASLATGERDLVGNAARGKVAE